MYLLQGCFPRTSSVVKFGLPGGAGAGTVPARWMRRTKGLASCPAKAGEDHSENLTDGEDQSCLICTSSVVELGLSGCAGAGTVPASG